MTTTKLENIHGVKVGMIFYTTWGYDHTNIDYFEVVKITAKFATVRPIESQRTEDAFLQGTCVPVPGAYVTGSGWVSDSIRTGTDIWSGAPVLKNADGHDHIGYLYQGEALRYTAYA